MLAGLWRQRETWDGTYTGHDLVEANRVLDVHEENQRRAAEAARESQKNQR